ncbi:MAG: PIN domain-containing protein [Akkermansiaceae bacterium]|jgi:predicted nucleic acid-binding protein|nr:PIN domain-containing protein [Akkermansiaceae bacterium]
MPNAFVDTNILVYAAEGSRNPHRKTVIARKLLLEPDLFLSVQVLNEFVACARHPQKLAMTRKEEGEWLALWMQKKVAPLTASTFVAALEIHHLHGLSHWDSLIVASASETKCQVLYSEDLNHGQNFDGLKVVNPFLAT